MQRTFGYLLGSILLILLHTSVIKFLSIGGIVPDILVLWVVYLALREGQIAGTVAGFCLGIVIDLVSGPDGMLGLSSLSKTLAGFTAGYFYNENKMFQILGGYQFLVAVGVASLVHNIVYFLIFLQGTTIGWWDAMLLYSMPTTLYTVAVGLVPMFAFARKYLS
jgi:rod shape-determining protein MreD